MLPRRLGLDARRHVVGKNHHLGLEIDAPVLALDQHVLVGADKCVGGAHVDQRVAPERLRQLGAAGLAHQLHVGHVGTAVGPVVAAGQGSGGAAGVKCEFALDPAGLEVVEKCLQPGLAPGPIVHRRLQGGCDIGGGYGPGEVAADHHQFTVAAGFEAG